MYYPYRMPYMGGKQKLAYQLISIMREYKPDAKYFVDLFGGGGAMSFMALQMGYSVTYNDFDADISGLIKYIQERAASGVLGKYGFFPDEWYEFVSRETFKTCLNEHTPFAEMARICYSFGNNRRSYLFNPELERIKSIAHDIVVFRNENAVDAFNNIMDANITSCDKPTINERRLDFRRQTMEAQRFDLEQLERLVQLEQLQQLERLEQLERLQQLEQLTVCNSSYDSVNLPYTDSEVIVYCDPPYANTGGYLIPFDSDRFHKWVKAHRLTIFVSEYESDLFEIHSKNVRCTLSATDNKRIVKERLYCNKNLDVLGQLNLF